MDAVRRIAQAIMQGQGNAPQQAAAPPSITPWDLQRLADAQKRGATPGVPGPADFAAQAAPQAAGAANPAGGPTGGFAPPDVAANTAQTAPMMPPVTASAPAMPLAAAPAMPQPQAPPEMPPSLAIGPEMASPGMVRMPSTDLQLQEWQKLMDSLQFGRQGQ